MRRFTLIASKLHLLKMRLPGCLVQLTPNLSEQMGLTLETRYRLRAELLY